MSKKGKRILIIAGILLVVVGVSSYAMKSKIMKLVKGGDNKRVAAQQSAKIEPIAWDPSQSGNDAMFVLKC